MRAGDELDDHPAALDPLDGPITRVDPQLLTDPFLNGYLPALSDSTRHFTQPPEYILGDPSMDG
jgi:hypothetical protein